MSLIMILCIGVLACAMTPSLTEMLAEKVEGLSSGQRGENSGGVAGGSPSDDDGQNGVSPGVSGETDGYGQPGGEQPDTLKPGVNADWMQGENQVGYEIPDGQPVEAPASVSGRYGYEPIREEAELILPEEGENLADSIPPGNTGSDLSFDGEFYPYYAMLEADMRQLYNQIYANAIDGVQNFAPVVPVQVNKLKTVFEAVYNDHPELFWLETGYSCKCLLSGSCVEIALKYNVAAENLGEAKQKFMSRAEQILQAARTLGSDQDKERFVHDSLMQSVEYVLDAPMNQSAYSALVEGKSVCAGYARAFQYLMQQMGIPCYYCTGYAGEDHAWNIVKLDTDYHNVDVTWDDTDTPTYDYFNKSDREYASTHRRTGLSVYLPACVSGADIPVNSEGGSAAGTGEKENSGNGGASADGQDTGDGSQEGFPDDIAALINTTPVEPLTWQSRTGADLDVVDTASTEEEKRQEALAKAGITEEDVRDTLEEYYEDCEKLLKGAGTGDRQFTNVVPESLWNSIERAYSSGDYKKGYVEDALKALGADSFVINLQVQDLGGGYLKLYHNVYTY